MMDFISLYSEVNYHLYSPDFMIRMLGRLTYLYTTIILDFNADHAVSMELKLKALAYRLL